MFLRIIFRHKYVYATFVRAWSKSFISIMALMLRCILYPGAKIATVAGGKGQSAEILGGKVDEICKLIPAMELSQITKPQKGYNNRYHRSTP